MKVKTKVLLTNQEQRKIKETGQVKYIIRFVDEENGKSLDVWSNDPLPVQLDGFTPATLELSITQGTKGLNMSILDVQIDGKK